MKGTKRVLLVEDDPNLGFVVKDHLVESGFEVTLARDGNQGFEEFYKNRFDILLLDVMLPKKDGFALAKDIRKINVSVPIIFLTAKGQVDDRIEGFKIGADDYLTKPFEIEELELRMEAILKRVSKLRDTVDTSKKDVFKLGDLEFNYKDLSLKSGKEVTSLTRKEADLLRLLAIHENQVLEREMALKMVWGSDDYFLGRSMDVFISKLRKYLKADPKVKINNVHGVGFKLTVE